MQTMEQPPQYIEYQSLCSQLEPPPRALFSDVGGDPCQPDAATASDAASFYASISSQLVHLAALAADLDAVQLGLSNLTNNNALEEVFPSKGGRTTGLLIEELSEEEDTTTTGGGSSSHIDTKHAEESLIKILLHVATYGSDDSNLPNPWSNDQTREAAIRLLDVLASKLDSNLRIDNINQAPLQQQTASTPAALLSAALPSLTRSLRPTILAPSDQSRSETSRLEPYAGPDNWERFLAASQLTWVVQQLGAQAELSQHALQLVHPLLSAAAIDPSPIVQSCGLWGLYYIFSSTNQQILAPWIETTAATAQRAVVGCDTRAWPAAAALATQVAALSTQGGASFINYAVSLFEALLEEGERHSHNTERSVVWLSTLPHALFSAFGLQLTRYFSRLMPLLLEWCVSARKSVRLGALRAVLDIVQVTWPRMPAHAAAIWSVLERTYEDEVWFAGSTSEDILEAVGAAAVGVWACGGETFRASVQENAAATSGDEPVSLLEFVLERNKTVHTST